MNIPVLIVAIVMLLAVVGHVIGGTKETAQLAPPPDDAGRSASWVQAMAAFQMLAVDLFVVMGVLFVIALSDWLPFERELTLGLAGLFALWGAVWLIQMIWVKSQGVSLLRLPHWLIWFVCAGLLWWGA